MGPRRLHRFAANPDEEVVQPSVIGSLFPHLNHHETNTFRWALSAGLAVIVILYAAGFTFGSATAAAALLPIVYLVYLYEVRVYRDAPLPVVAFTFGGGLAVGLAVSALTWWITSQTPVLDIEGAVARINSTGFVLFALCLPIVAEAAKPLPSLFLRRRAEFRETIDGLVFGVAAGLGFAFAETVVVFSNVLPPADRTEATSQLIFLLVTAAILRPIMHGTTTGIITAFLWQRSHRPLPKAAATSVVAAVLGHVAFQAGSIWLFASQVSPLVTLGYQASVVAVLLTFVRWLLHDALLREAEQFGFAVMSCPNCSRSITAAAFCPQCGMALTATRPEVRPARLDTVDASSKKSS